VTIFLKFILSFLAGSIPFAKVAMIGTGIDITKVGSKNPGFNNVLRVSSKWRAAIALVGDISKGFIALLILLYGQTRPADVWIMGIAAVMGHCWSPFLGFNGGKGVATTVGVLLYIDWALTVICLPLYPLLRMFGRKMGWRQEGAISSLTTMLVLSIAVLILRGLVSGLFAFVLFAIILIRHVPNLREIMGTKHE
jgi:glycerol-3-phosphate acyltransferase PlsY